MTVIHLAFSFKQSTPSSKADKQSSRQVDKMVGYTCEICDPVKMFTRRNNLKRHVKQVHEKETQYQCGICKMEFARKAHKEDHLKSCSYKADLGKIEFTPIYVSTDWRVDIPADYHGVDPYPLLRTAINAFRDSILKHNTEHMPKLTFTITAYVVFKKVGESELQTNSPVEFTSYRWIVHPGIDDRRQLNRAYDDLVRRIEKYAGLGSGCIIDYLNSLNIKVMPL